MRCDLHVHSKHSGMCTLPILNRICRESYSEPEALYAVMKQRGMDLVTVTDHDSIDAAESLRKYPDFFVSEEVTCYMPSGTEVHLGVYGISERQHIEIQRRRKDISCLLAYLSERSILFSANHLFSSLTGRRTAEDFDMIHEHFPAYEIKNGQMHPDQNVHAEAVARTQSKLIWGGSDGHTLASAGTTYTEVHGARDSAEFLAGLRSRRGVVRGEDGSYGKLTRDSLLIAVAMLCEKPWLVPLMPLMALIPVATWVHWRNEIEFLRRWGRAPVRKPARRELEVYV